MYPIIGYFGVLATRNCMSGFGEVNRPASASILGFKALSSPHFSWTESLHPKPKSAISDPFGSFCVSVLIQHGRPLITSVIPIINLLSHIPRSPKSSLDMYCTYARVCIYIYTYIHTSVCMCIYICTYTFVPLNQSPVPEPMSGPTLTKSL